MSEESKSIQGSVPASPEQPKPSAMEIFLSSPDIQKAIAEIPKLIERAMQTKTKWATLPTVILILGLVFAVIGAITYLAVIDKLSSDSIALVFGVIVGASFTYLQKFLPGG